MKKFILLTKHTDEELTLILQNLEDKGLRLCNVRGNFFEFKNNFSEKGIVRSYTFYPKGNAQTTAFQMSQECVYLRENGWDTLCTSKVESLGDTRRHIFLIKEKETASNLKFRAEKEKEVKNKARRTAVSSLIMNIFYLLAFVFLLTHDLVKISTSLSYIIATVFAFFALLYSLYLNLCSIYDCFAKKPKYLTSLDKSTLTMTVLLVIFALFLFFDSVWNKNSTSSEKVKIGSSSFVLYSDSLPIKLEDLNANTSAKYRTSRNIFSSSPLASYIHFFDESFGSVADNAYSEAKTNIVCYLSCTSYKTNCKWLLNAVCRQLKVQNPKGTFVQSEDSIVMIKSGFPLDTLQLNKVVNAALSAMACLSI